MQGLPLINIDQEEDFERLKQDVNSFILAIFKRKHPEGTLEYAFVETHLKKLNPNQILEFYTFFIEEKGETKFFNEAGFSSLNLFKKAFIEFKENILQKVWKDEGLDKVIGSLAKKLIIIFDILKTDEMFDANHRETALKNKLIKFKDSKTKETIISNEEYKILEQTTFQELYRKFIYDFDHGLREQITILVKNYIAKGVFKKDMHPGIELGKIELPEKIITDIENSYARIK